MIVINKKRKIRVLFCFERLFIAANIYSNIVTILESDTHFVIVYNDSAMKSVSFQYVYDVSQTKISGLNYQKIRRQNLFWRMGRVEAFVNH